MPWGSDGTEDLVDDSTKEAEVVTAPPPVQYVTVRGVCVDGKGRFGPDEIIPEGLFTKKEIMGFLKKGAVKRIGD